MSSNKVVLLPFVLLLISCADSGREQLNSLEEFESERLIEVDELQKIISHDTIRLIDIRKPEYYAENHIPGALNIWRPDIQNDSLPYGGVVASRKKVERLFSRLGIKNTDYLIIYDNNALCDAARLWWVLDHYGFKRTALLHGGLKSWRTVGDLATDVPQNEPSNFSLPKGYTSENLISLEDLIKEKSDPQLQVIDARSKEEFDGEYIKNGAFDNGRIPGSVNIDWIETVNYEEKTFKTYEELRALYASKGLTEKSNIVTYCHSGVRSAHSLFVLTELLGFKNVRNYDGSWIEWSHHGLPTKRNSTKLKLEL